MPLMLDLFAGTGGASRAFKAAGWDVVTVDNDPQHGTDVVADLTAWSWDGPRPEVVWASPPCTGFSRWAMPWCRKKGPQRPDLSLVEAALRIVMETQPRYWVLENVRGAVPFLAFLGPPRVVTGPFHLWGYFPPFRLDLPAFKERFSSRDVVKRAAVPARLSAALLAAVTRQPELPLALTQNSGT